MNNSGEYRYTTTVTKPRVLGTLATSMGSIITGEYNIEAVFINEHHNLVDATSIVYRVELEGHSVDIVLTVSTSDCGVNVVSCKVTDRRGTASREELHDILSETAQNVVSLIEELEEHVEKEKG